MREGEQSIETCYALGLPLPVVDGLTDPGDNPLSAARKGELSSASSEAIDNNFIPQASLSTNACRRQTATGAANAEGRTFCSVA